MSDWADTAADGLAAQGWDKGNISRALRSAVERETQVFKNMLREVRDRGLIYWEPNTDRGSVTKAQMIAKIDVLIGEGP